MLYFIIYPIISNNYIIKNIFKSSLKWLNCHLLYFSLIESKIVHTYVTFILSTISAKSVIAKQIYEE